MNRSNDNPNFINLSFRAGQNPEGRWINLNICYKLKAICLFLLPGALTFFLGIALLIAGKFAPFGDNSLASMDANIQYLDFFAYLKEVLQGNNNLGYTFSKSLGGNTIAIFSYYLSSPFSFLVFFFPKTKLNDFFDLLVILKWSAIAISFNYFLCHRFKGRWSGNFQRTIPVILSLGFALCQYDVAQSSNVMWLDGVFFLPIILLLVYRIIYHEKGKWKLSVAVGLAILSNWYTAGMDCLFSFFWFLFELALKDITVRNANQVCDGRVRDVRKIKPVLSENFQSFARYFFYIILGVMLSAILFLPTVFALGGSTKGGLQWGLINFKEINGYLLNFLPLYTYGSCSSYGHPALFCGSIAAIGFIGYFIDRNVRWNEKLLHLLLAVFGLLMLYWNPLYTLFNLVKQVDS